MPDLPKTLAAYWWRDAPNFGDALAPVLLSRLLGVQPIWTADAPRLLSVGSIVPHSLPGDTLWGSGLHTPRGAGNWQAGDKTFLAVRGPRTRQFVIDRGGQCPAIYGDPALLLPTVHPVTLAATRDLAILPHLDDDAGWNLGHRQGIPTINPGWPWERIVQEITGSARLVTSSLHGLIVAEAYGVPVTWANFIKRPGKFEDYYLGTGRQPTTPLDWPAAIHHRPPAITTPAPPDLLPALLEHFIPSETP